MYDVKWLPKASEDYSEWEKTSARVVARIDALVVAIQKDPRKGIGKPEPLKHQWAGYWSRRITKRHRVLYKIEGTIVRIYRCAGHYGSDED